MRPSEKITSSSLELSEDYDHTLKAFSSAVEARDKEANGHTQRVTDLALSLARSVGQGVVEIEHIRRGSMLHDIGNLLVPEEILHKQGELTVKDWVVIHMHPFYAYEMLRSIDFLKPALDIPYYHHERWDGTGYPRGLKGEHIPMAARIFSVVDVWDALRSDRPYRKAWPEAKARRHMQTLSGVHFDPEVVAKFFKMKKQPAP